MTSANPRAERDRAGEHVQELLDQAGEESFPASDPTGWIIRHLGAPCSCRDVRPKAVALKGPS